MWNSSDSPGFGLQALSQRAGCAEMLMSPEDEPSLPDCAGLNLHPECRMQTLF